MDGWESKRRGVMTNKSQSGDRRAGGRGSHGAEKRRRNIFIGSNDFYLRRRDETKTQTCEVRGID